jgi:hypothetical protein
MFSLLPSAWFLLAAPGRSHASAGGGALITCADGSDSAWLPTKPPVACHEGIGVRGDLFSLSGTATVAYRYPSACSAKRLAYRPACATSSACVPSSTTVPC